MSHKIETLDHTCNVVRREFQDEFRDITLFFIVHAPGDRENALINKRRELTDHPAGSLALPALREAINEETDQSKLVVITSAKEEKKFSIFRKNKIVAVYFINTQDFTDQDESRQKIYHLAWDTLSLLEHIKNENEEHYKKSGDVVTPQYDAACTAREHMLADAFTAIILELDGQKGIIRNLAKKRCLMSLQAVAGYKAEEYPFPVAADAAQIVFDELTENSHKASPITHATNVTREIGQTYDDTAIQQWSVFAKAAQEMAWMDFNKNKIMSTALYTSEDPYVRSTAYIVTEILGMEPTPLTSLGEYNPFTDQEANERLHKRTCEELLKTLLSKLTPSKNETLFKKMARQQNTKLINGSPLGWDAYAIMHAAEAFQLANGKGIEAHNAVEEAFRHLDAHTDWKSIVEFTRLIMNQKREGKEITLKRIIKLCASNENYVPIITALEWAEPEITPEETDEEIEEGKVEEEEETKEKEPAEKDDDGEEEIMHIKNQLGIRIESEEESEERVRKTEEETAPAVQFVKEQEKEEQKKTDND